MASCFLSVCLIRFGIIFLSRKFYRREIIASWSPLHNTKTEIHYFTGKTLDTKKDTQTFFGRVSWFF